jgi:hypothetical protein
MGHSRPRLSTSSPSGRVDFTISLHISADGASPHPLTRMALTTLPIALLDRSAHAMVVTACKSLVLTHLLTQWY